MAATKDEITLATLSDHFEETSEFLIGCGADPSDVVAALFAAGSRTASRSLDAGAREASSERDRAA